MTETRNQRINSQSIEIFIDGDDNPIKKKIEFKGVERQREQETKKTRTKKGKKKDDKYKKV